MDKQKKNLAQALAGSLLSTLFFAQVASASTPLPPPNPITSGSSTTSGSLAHPPVVVLPTPPPPIAPKPPVVTQPPVSFSNDATLAFLDYTALVRQAATSRAKADQSLKALDAKASAAISWLEMGLGQAAVQLRFQPHQAAAPLCANQKINIADFYRVVNTDQAARLAVAQQVAQDRAALWSGIQRYLVAHPNYPIDISTLLLPIDAIQPVGPSPLQQQLPALQMLASLCY